MWDARSGEAKREQESERASVEAGVPEQAEASRGIPAFDMQAISEPASE